MGLYALSNLIDELTMDTESLDQTVLAVNFDIFKLNAADELNTLFKETSKKFMSSRFSHMDSYTAVALKKMSIRIMGKMTQEISGILVRQGPHEAIRALESFHENKMQDILLSQCEGCIHYGLSVNRDMITILRILSRLVGDQNCSMESDYRMRWKDIDCEGCAMDIASLSSSHRIKMMKALNHDNQSFKGLSTVTGMRTGHLQFHLKALIDQGLVIKAEKGVYSITKKGSTALNSLADFDRHMKLYKTIEEAYRLE